MVRKALTNIKVVVEVHSKYYLWQNHSQPKCLPFVQFPHAYHLLGRITKLVLATLPHPPSQAPAARHSPTWPKQDKAAAYFHRPPVPPNPAYQSATTTIPSIPSLPVARGYGRLEAAEERIRGEWGHAGWIWWAASVRCRGCGRRRCSGKFLAEDIDVCIFKWECRKCGGGCGLVRLFLLPRVAHWGYL